jgi:hypothetical protein
MASKSKTNRMQMQTADQKLIGGLTEHASTVSSLVIAGTSYTTAAMIAVLQARVATGNAVTSTRATWQAAVQGDRDKHAQTQAFVSGLLQVLHVAFAGQIEALNDFGLVPHKPQPQRTPEQKALQTKKAAATRAARHTMGPKQKAAIKGKLPTS